MSHKSRVQALLHVDQDWPFIDVRNRDGSFLGMTNARHALALLKTDRWNLVGKKSLRVRNQIDPAKYVPEVSYFPKSRQSAIETGAACHVARLEEKGREDRRGLIGTHTEGEWREICYSFGNRCLRCSATNVELTKDHVVPVSKGGTGYASNLQPLCGPCNSWKGTKEIDFRTSAVRR